MKFVLANWGTRGEVEPFLAVGRELLRAGHEVHIAVAPEMVAFAEAAGLTAVGYGPELRLILDPHRDFWTCLYSTPWQVRRMRRLFRDVAQPLSACRDEVTATLMSLAQGADLLITGMNFEDIVANVAEYLDIPLSTLFHFPVRANGQSMPMLPPVWGRSVMTAVEWVTWLGRRRAEDDAQRRELGLPKATGPWPRRIAERGSLEIQAYDGVCFPGLATEWARWNQRPLPERPFVGALTMELHTDADDEVASWIAAGSPPICFGFGSVGVESAAGTLALISSVSARLGERALVCAAGTDFGPITPPAHVKVVGQVNYSAIFPLCSAVVHHGGSGTTNATLRAGVPSLILWTLPDQALWGNRVKSMKVGATRRFSAVTEKTLIADLRTVLAPQCQTRARTLAARMTKPAESATTAAELAENYARHKRGV